MAPGEAGEPGLGSGVALHQGDDPFHGHVVDHIKLVAALGHDLYIAGPRVNVHGVLGRLFQAAHAGQGRPLPVGALLPEIPVPLGVKVLEGIGPQGDRRVKGKGGDVFRLLKDVLGHDKTRAPADQEVGMEAGIRHLEVHRQLKIAFLFDTIHIGAEGP